MGFLLKEFKRFGKSSALELRQIHKIVLKTTAWIILNLKRNENGI
jgi:hypothetical protein